MHTSCRSARVVDVASRFGGEVILKFVKVIHLRKKDDEDDEEETESLWDTLTTALASILPFQGEMGE